MNTAEYDAWYETPRGGWIGETEFKLIRRMLAPQPGEKLLDVGCGTGWFTRRMAKQPGVAVTGIDPNREWLNYARERDDESAYSEASACELPFSDRHFDLLLSVTALCFIADWSLALADMVRVTRKRFAIGVLNRTSLLWRDKGRHGGQGAYRGAHWHTAKELRLVLDTLPVQNVRVDSAVFVPSGSCIAILVERALPSSLTFGGFLLVSGDVATSEPAG